ncbi:hypothetical protein ABT010_40610 [Streptomyces sp. NPDC002668]|uniref:hypothetical protein n=1 Tax=Streptomyces sp. NPDC002668 TaxID=3154422 RepID=UPI00333274B6
MPVSSATEAKLRAAMARLLAGQPQHTSGALTKSNLAREAKVSHATMHRAQNVLAAAALAGRVVALAGQVVARGGRSRGGDHRGGNARHPDARAPRSDGADTTIDLVGTIGRRVLADLMPDRRIRTRPRVVKRAISKHNRTSYKATISIDILLPEASSP